jgi:hypothetical protein
MRLISEENAGKPYLGDHMMKVVRPVFVSTEVPHLHVAKIAQHVREREGRKAFVAPQPLVYQLENYGIYDMKLTLRCNAYTGEPNACSSYMSPYFLLPESQRWRRSIILDSICPYLSFRSEIPETVNNASLLN